MPRLLAFAYYVPPLGMSGVQRVSKTAALLGAHGWRVDLVAPTPGTYFARDTTLLDELTQAGVTIHRTRSVDPTRLAAAAALDRTTPLSEGRRKRLARLTAWLTVPDNKIGWLPFAVAKADALLASERFDAVFASAPPYTALLAAAWVARRHRLPLVLDLRDDWLGNPRHAYPTRVHRRLHALLERWTFRRADALLVISEAMRQQVARRHPDLAGRLRVVPQGYDERDMDAPLRPRQDPRFWVTYTGVFYDAQSPDTFLHGLRLFLNRRPDVPVLARFAGLKPGGFDTTVERLGLAETVVHLGYLPHAHAVREQRWADLLWMTVGRRVGAEGISTGKLFEYVGTRRPVLGLVPDGTAREALAAYGAAYLADPDDPGAVAERLEQAYDDRQAGTVPVPNEAFVRRHGRAALAAEVAAVLDAAVAARARS